MTDEPENLTLKMLRSIDEKLDQALADLHDVRLAGVNRRLDRLDERVARLERRLELSDAP